MIKKLDFITREFVRQNPNAVFVFGDNLAERGYGGQAKEMRGEPNAIGIPTKRAPSMAPNAFFTDADFDRVKPIIDRQIALIKDAIAQGKTVYFPASGIGTGLAELSTRSPKIFEYLQSELEDLEYCEI